MHEIDQNSITTGQIHGSEPSVDLEEARKPTTKTGWPQSRAVILDPSAAQPDRGVLDALDTLHERTLACQGDDSEILQLALGLGTSALPTQPGKTLDFLQVPATLGTTYLTASRIVEPHLDALAILAQAGQQNVSTDDFTWGVFAAQGPGAQLTATVENRGWRLSGD